MAADLLKAVARVGRCLPETMRDAFSEVVDYHMEFPQLHPAEVTLVIAFEKDPDVRRDMLGKLRINQKWMPSNEKGQVPRVGDGRVVKIRRGTRSSHPDARAIIEAKKAERPTYGGAVMAGDSHMVRLAFSLGYSSHSDDRRRHSMGLCQSGQTIAGLAKPVEAVAAPCEKIIVLIGTNDLLYQDNVETIVGSYRALVEGIRKKMGNSCKVTLVTIPPIPAVPDKAESVIEVNNFIKTLPNTFPGVLIADLFSALVGDSGSADLDSFAVTYKSDGKPDLVHLSNVGLAKMRVELDKAIQAMS